MIKIFEYDPLPKVTGILLYPGCGYDTWPIEKFEKINTFVYVDPLSKNDLKKLSKKLFEKGFKYHKVKGNKITISQKIKLDYDKNKRYKFTNKGRLVIIYTKEFNDSFECDELKKGYDVYYQMNFGYETPIKYIELLKENGYYVSLSLRNDIVLTALFWTEDSWAEADFELTKTMGFRPLRIKHGGCVLKKVRDLDKEDYEKIVELLKRIRRGYKLINDCLFIKDEKLINKTKEEIKESLKFFKEKIRLINNIGNNVLKQLVNKLKEFMEKTLEDEINKEEFKKFWKENKKYGLLSGVQVFKKYF